MECVKNNILYTYVCASMDITCLQYERTALHIARDGEVVAVLLKNGANVHAVDSVRMYMYTALCGMG